MDSIIDRIRAICEEKNIPFTTENEFVVTKYNRMFDGFAVKKSAVKSLDMDYAKYSSIRPDTMTLSSSGYIISADSYEKFLNKQQMIDAEIKRLHKLVLPPNEALNKMLEEKGCATLIEEKNLSFESLNLFLSDS